MCLTWRMDSTSEPQRPTDPRDPNDADQSWTTSGPTPPPPPPQAPAPGYQYTPPAPGVGGGPPREALAGFWIRFAGFLIDGILISIVVAILAAIFDLDDVGVVQVFAGDGVANPRRGFDWLTFLIGLPYFTYFHATAAGQTPGNRAVGIRVLDADSGGSISYLRAFLRFLMSYVSAIPLGLGYFWMLWDGRRQTWHDKVANSLVVKSGAYPPGPFGRPAA